MHNTFNELEHVQTILSVLAQILARGLSAEQRDAVLRDMPIPNKRNADEFTFYRALLDTYETRKDLDFVVDLTRRIEGTRSFYQDVGPDLDRLRFLLSKHQKQLRQTNTKPFVFVLMPFRDEHFALYERAIKPALENLGCHVEHAKDAHTVERIVDAIYTQISRAEFIVADTTGKNPNVFYEIGYAHALGKKVILLVQDTQDIPFDIAGLRHIQYKPSAPHVLGQDLSATAAALLRQNTDSAS